jgi:hypothetical protein
VNGKRVSVPSFEDAPQRQLIVEYDSGKSFVRFASKKPPSRRLFF